MKFALPLLFICTFGFGPNVWAQDLLLYFPHNSAVIDPSAGLERLKSTVELTRNTKGIWFLEGRTSSSGNAAYNDTLSLRRAEAVRNFLLTQQLPLHTIRLAAVGETLAQPTDVDADRAVFVRFVPTTTSTTPETAAQPLAPAPSIQVTVVDAVTRKPLAGSGTYLTQTVLFTEDGLPLPLFKTKSLSVHFAAAGYQDSTVNILPSPAEQTVELLPEGVLQKLVFQNIYFYPNTAEIVPESYRAMEQMLKQLQTRAGVNIQIRGHVNWPEPNPITSQISQELQELSDKRAQAVMAWLIKKGIPAAHLSAVGLGYSQMVFPKANTEGQQAQNRRVEVLLLK